MTNETPEVELKKNRKMALMMGAISGIALIAIVYAFVQKEKSSLEIKRAQASADSLRAELQHCALQVQEEQKRSEQAARYVLEVQKRAEGSKKTQRSNPKSQKKSRKQSSK
jgi:hypothetical protein